MIQLPASKQKILIQIGGCIFETPLDERGGAYFYKDVLLKSHIMFIRGPAAIKVKNGLPLEPGDIFTVHSNLNAIILEFEVVKMTSSKVFYAILNNIIKREEGCFNE